MEHPQGHQPCVLPIDSTPPSTPTREYNYQSMMPPSPPHSNSVSPHKQHPSHGGVPICRQFLRGRCPYGPACQYIHVDQSGAPTSPGAVPPPAYHVRRAAPLPPPPPPSYAETLASAPQSPVVDNTHSPIFSNHQSPTMPTSNGFEAEGDEQLFAVLHMSSQPQSPPNELAMFEGKRFRHEPYNSQTGIVMVN